MAGCIMRYLETRPVPAFAPPKSGSRKLGPGGSRAAFYIRWIHDSKIAVFDLSLDP